METVDRNVYFEDVRLQMEAKLWGEEYSRHRPPKQVQEKDERRVNGPEGKALDFPVNLHSSHRLWS